MSGGDRAGNMNDGYTVADLSPVDKTQPEFDEQLALPGSAPLTGVRSRRRLRLAVVIVSVLVIAAALGLLGVLAWTNYDRANRWEQRAAQLDRNITALNEVVIKRSEQLNARTREVNEMARTVTRAERALERSEDDVAQLSQRQRELANEKAQLEDAQAALQQAASAFATCKGGLIDLIAYVVQDDYASANYYVDQVNANCNYADQAFSDYLTRYGG
jgi:TolA-binding protein